MNKENFVQGMKHEEAMKFSLGYNGLKDDVAKNNFAILYAGLKDRPDYDGKLSPHEANKWYREGNGQPLFVDAAKIDLQPVQKSEFGSVGDSKFINFGHPKHANLGTGLIYGTIKLTLLDDKGTINLEERVAS